MEKDIRTKRFLADNNRFSDLLNGLIFQGKMVIKPEDLLEMDTQSGIWQLPDFIRNKQRKKKIKARDLIRKMAFGTNFVVYGIENQESVDYSLPLRTMIYDTGVYEQQTSLIRKRIRKEPQKYTSGEYLYGFSKDSRLYPAITLVLYYGESWDGPKDLYGMIDFTDLPPELISLISNYQMNLIEVRKLEDTSVFHTDIRQVFDFIRYSEDKFKLKELTERDPYYREMEEDAFDMVVTYANATELVKKENYYSEGGKINMCKALQEMIEDGRMEGCAEGQQKKLIEMVCKKIKKGKSPGVIADELEEEISSIERIYNVAQSCAPDYDCDRIFDLLR